MTIDDQIRDGKHDMILQYDVNKKKLQKHHLYHQAKLISMSILLVKKDYHLVKDKY